MRDLGWGAPQAEGEPGEVASRSPACLSTVNRGQKGEGAEGAARGRARRAAEGPLVRQIPDTDGMTVK